MGIIKGVQDAEDRLVEAQKRLVEAEKQLAQANLIISEIKNETITAKKSLLNLDSLQAKRDLVIRFERALATFRAKERQIFLDIKQQIVSLVLQRTVNRVQETFKSKERAATLITETKELSIYLNNPIVSRKSKREVLAKILKSQLNIETFKFLMVLVDRDRINVLGAIINNYLELVYQAASIKMIEVSTASEFTNSQKETLIQKLKELTNAREIRLITTIDPSLIGGFLIQTESKIIDFTIKNQLQQLAKHLDTVLKI